MTSRTPSSAFEHDPLPDSTTHFRLLRILHGDFGHFVECEISSWPIDDAPPYYAISYTWGDPADMTEIIVNNKLLAVRRNCEYVLQQAFASKASLYYWIDAICIAQTSIQERNHQVGIMGKIYSGAKHVFACVGPHADDSEWLMTTVGQKQSILESVHRWSQSQESSFLYNMINPFYIPQYWFLEGRGHVWRTLRCLFTMHVSKQLRMAIAFFSFMKRPYFRRVWVLQELHLATRVSYCCGADIQPGQYLRALDSLVDYWINRHDSTSRNTLGRYQEWVLRRCLPDDRPSKELWQALQRSSSTLVISRNCLRLGISAQKQGLGEMLTALQNFRCVDTRDNLYGILSIVDWPQGRVPVPDYTKDDFEVAKHVLSLWFQHRSYPPIEFQCPLLLKLFNVTLELASLRDAIALRSSVAPQMDLGLQDNHDSEIAKGETNWRGIHIIEGNRISKHADGRRQSNLHSCYVEQVQNGRFVLIRLDSHITVRAHVETKVGDWCVVEDLRPFRHGSYGLIIRELDDHRYVVVGSALVDNTGDGLKYELEEKSSLSRFKGWLDPEDLMVLAWMLDELKGKEQVSDEDIEKFVNMRVCGWKGSSYFQEVSDDDLNTDFW